MPERRPPWWPENEGWSARAGWPRWWFVLALVPIIFFVSLGFLFGRRGHGPWFLWPLGILFVVLMIRRRRSPRWFPVSRLVEAAGKLADGDYTVRVPDVERGPMRDVIQSFNGMASQLQQSSEQRRRWLADLGHELRNPLTVIQGELEAMIDGVHIADPDQLAMLLDETALMSRLLDDLRTLSLSESGELKLERESVELSDVVDDALAPFREEARRSQRNLVAEVPPGRIHADPMRLREVLTNLIANALRHARQSVSLTATRSASTWRIEVADDGPGIPPELRTRAFERFVKGGDSKGTGLGLSIARDLVKAHGGEIDISANSEHGTTFSVSLPDTGFDSSTPG
ncbi:MAG: HAMP domain-containing histidine kinase [Acidimicrobiia bacterium]|nr:HAMP domain-containing histidine kinase [Acidimicrobiia bacterium]